MTKEGGKASPTAALMQKKRNKLILVNDRMQKGYRYELVAPVGQDFRSDFRPELTPKEMLSLGVFCGKWRKKGWIHPDDPSGWFQWYCRYYMGRRMPEEDARQIRRWKAIRRHLVQVRRNCEPGDQTCRPRQRQALLHWAYDSRKI